MLEPRLAEVATENHWISQGAVITRRALRTKFAKVDLLGADVLAVFPDGSKTWTQATTAQRGESIRRRRRKLEAVPWAADSDRVFVFELEVRDNVVRRSKRDYFFRVHRLDIQTRSWLVEPEPIPIPRAWFRVKQEAKEGKDEDREAQAPQQRVAHE